MINHDRYLLDYRDHIDRSALPCWSHFFCKGMSAKSQSLALCVVLHQRVKPSLRKKRYRNSTPGVLLLQIVSFFLEGHSFFLNNHVYRKKSAPKQKGTIFQKSAPGGVVT